MPSTIPAGGISLHGPVEDVGDLKPGTSSAILLKLGDDVLQAIKSASKDELRLVTGSTPKLRIGGRTIDLSISPDAFRNELYASTTGASTTDLTFTTLVSHRAELKSDKQHGGETAGADAALAALQNSLATYKQEKEASKTTISNQLLNVPRNRAEAARQDKLDRKKRLMDVRGGSQPASPSLSALGTPRLGAATTSAPLSEDEVRLKAMRKPLVHLLAIGPTTKEEMRSQTHVPKDDLEMILPKIGKQVDGKWQLTERAYKELDVFAFGYPSDDDRKAVVDNAIRAYDRLRLGKEDNLWQLLLPQEERGKGKVLSRLHNGGLGGAGSSLTPHYQPSPAPVNSTEDTKMASSANTPRLGSSTPRIANSKGDVTKRLLSKDPQKAHRLEEAKMKKTKAAEEAKEKKRKEKEEAASDREGKRPAKRQATGKKVNSKVKSADIVHSSDDESGEDGEVKERPAATSKTAAAAKKKVARSSTSPEESSDSAKAIKEVKKTAATKVKPASTTAKATASPAVKATNPTAAASSVAGKSTPQPTNGLSAPSSQHKGRSPSAVGSRPGVPSPLGAARPRVASDVSDRSAVGVQRVRQGAETPRGLGITNGVVGKRTDTSTSKGTATPVAGEAKPKEKTTSDKAQKPTVNGTETPKVNGTAAPKANSTATPKANGATPKPKPETAGTKRKASDPPSQSQAAPKHRKTESSSSLTLSAFATNSSTTSNQTAQTSQTSPDASSSDTSTVLDTISYKTGVQQASKFKEQFYPAYNLLYDEIEGMQRRGEHVGRDKVEKLRAMHGRLVEMKREIEAASRRGRGEE